MATACVAGLVPWLDAAGASAAMPTTYYVDSVGGSDSNSGTSTATAWQTLAKVSGTSFAPGDQVLFDDGDTWHGLLTITSSGAAGLPITFGTYGSGAKPVLAGGGGSTETSTITLSNVHDVTLNGLEVTNSAGNLSVQTPDQRGVFVDASNMGEDSGITLENLDVSDIDGQGWSDIGRGGIVTMAQGSTTPTWFDNLKILNNEIADSNNYGISMISNWCGSGCAVFAPLSGDNDTPGAFTPSTNVLIQGNYIHDVSAAGIQTSTTQSAVISQNAVDRAVTNRLQYGGTGSYPSTSSGNVAIWWQNDRDTLAEYNAVSNTALNNFNVDNQDDQAFDIDEDAQRSIVQDNFSYNNAGGFIMTCCGGGNDAVIRYNVSQHDLSHPFTLSSGSRVRVYNNTVWSTTDTEPQWQPPASGNAEHGGTTVQVGVKTIVDTSYDGSGPQNGDTGVYNNIFYNPENVPFNALGGVAHYARNLYYAGPGVTPTVAADDPSPVTSSPLLSSPGTASPATGPITASSLATLLAGYAETGSSPGLNAGLSAGTTAPLTDLFGTAVPPGAPDLGAYQHAVSVTATTSLGTSLGNIASIADDDPATSWASAGSAVSGGTITETYGDARTISAVSLATAFGQGQGITSLDLQTWNGTAWVTQVAGAAPNWQRNDATVEWYTIPLPATVTTTKIQLVVHAGNTAWGHVAINELRASYRAFASNSQTSLSAGLSVQNMIDGNPATSWATGTPVPGNDGLTVDLGTPQTARSMSLSAAFGQGQGPTNVTVYAYTPVGYITVASGVALSWASNTSTVETDTIPLTTVCPSGLSTPCYAPTRYLLIVNSYNNTWGHWAINELAINS